MARVMTWIREWLRPPRNLLMLFVLVVCVPAATLITLGLRLLDQDRALARQRQIEFLDRAADDGIRVLQLDLATQQARLADGSCIAIAGDDAVCVTLHPDRIEAFPRNQIAYYPRAPQLKEAPAEAFAEIESHEFREPVDLEKALEASRKLTLNPDAAIRAGALLRRGRILVKLGRSDEALAAFNDLSGITGVSINNEPADLVAWRMRCSILESHNGRDELIVEAAILARALHAGNWLLDESTFHVVDGQLHQWLKRSHQSFDKQEEFAIALAWIYDIWTRERSNETSGVRVVNGDTTPVTVMWSFRNEKSAILIAGPQYVESHWNAELQKALAPARVFLAAPGTPPIGNEPKVQRKAADTGLPWTLVVASPPGQQEPREFTERRRNLVAGLGALVILIGAGSYFIWRAVNRELAVARLQSDFVSAVSHEFRTPLTTLRQFNELLADEDGPTAEKRRNFYNAQMRATERLHRLVESLLDFGRMEAGRHPYKFQPLDAAALAQDVTEEFRRESNPPGFTVECHAESDACPISADPEALSRALWNLLDNAVKYSGDSCTIEVHVTRMNGAVSIAVRDYGIGIPATEQKAVFQKFVRGAASRSAGIRGTGLGLAMVQHIVYAHHGTVNLQSAEGGGSTFTIVLPARGSA